MGDLGRDLKASRVDDVVTIVVSEQASAVSTGAVQTSRKSSTNSSIVALAGALPATERWLISPTYQTTPNSMAPVRHLARLRSPQT